jgi:arabinose-5-phosphate isomerase
MAMGDALAGALLHVKGFPPEHFAKFHPGGSLGKQLYLRVSDLYKNNEKPRVKPDSNLKKTILEITSKRLGATAVLDDGDTLIGIITDGDLRRMLEAKEKIENIRASEIMTKNPKTISDTSLAATALEKMRTNSITQLVVIDDQGNYLGFVHIHDILREGII